MTIEERQLFQAAFPFLVQSFEHAKEHAKKTSQKIAKEGFKR